jgi:hypothetical protein
MASLRNSPGAFSDSFLTELQFAGRRGRDHDQILINSLFDPNSSLERELVVVVLERTEKVFVLGPIALASNADDRRGAHAGNAVQQIAALRVEQRRRSHARLVRKDPSSL